MPDDLKSRILALSPAQRRVLDAVDNGLTVPNTKMRTLTILQGDGLINFVGVTSRGPALVNTVWRLSFAASMVMGELRAEGK